MDRRWGNFPGQLHFRRALERYLDSLGTIYQSLPAGWRLFLEHKPYEPAFYSTVIGDWGTSYYCARELGERAFSLIDLGHHVPNTNIEQIVARLIQFGKLGGFHFNDSTFGDDDLDTGSVKPFQLFLVFRELVDAELDRLKDFDPAYMELQALKRAFNTDVGPILAMARYRAGGAIDPVAAYRASGYRQQMERTRPAGTRSSAGIV